MALNLGKNCLCFYFYFQILFLFIFNIGNGERQILHPLVDFLNAFSSCISISTVGPCSSGRYGIILHLSVGTRDTGLQPSLLLPQKCRNRFLELGVRPRIVPENLSVLESKAFSCLCF